MTYPPIPRPVTTPDMRERARALLGAAQRRQNLYAQALVQAETGRTTVEPGFHPAMPGMSTSQGNSLDQVVQSITQASDQDLLQTQHTLAQARAQSQRLAAADTELHAFMAAAYGQVPAPQTHTSAPDVLDVQAREVSPQASKRTTDAATDVSPAQSARLPPA